jgi:S1-C subfamily serine protease
MKECTYCGGTLKDNRNKCPFCGREYEGKGFVSFALSEEAVPEKTSREEESLGDAIKAVTNATVHLSGIYNAMREDGSVSAEEISATGFFVEENGNKYIVTVAHFTDKVIERKGAMFANFPSSVLDTKDAFSVYPLVVDNMNDVSLIGMDLPAPEKTEILRLESRSSVDQGDSVITVGCPGHINFIHNKGTVALTSLADSPFSISKILCDLNTTHGNSGGAVVRVKDRAVIGMVKGAFEGTPNHTVCVAADAIKQLIYAYERNS